MTVSERDYTVSRYNHFEIQMLFYLYIAYLEFLRLNMQVFWTNAKIKKLTFRCSLPLIL